MHMILSKWESSTGQYNCAMNLAGKSQEHFKFELMSSLKFGLKTGNPPVKETNSNISRKIKILTNFINFPWFLIP